MKILEKLLLVQEMTKQQALDADTKKIQQINFKASLYRTATENTTMFFIIQHEKGAIFEFSQGRVTIL